MLLVGNSVFVVADGLTGQTSRQRESAAEFSHPAFSFILVVILSSRHSSCLVIVSCLICFVCPFSPNSTHPICLAPLCLPEIDRSHSIRLTAKKKEVFVPSADLFRLSFCPLFHSVFGISVRACIGWMRPLLH